MAFTLEQIKNALTIYRTDFLSRLGANGIKVTDYLTGKIATLPPLEGTFENRALFYLVPLLNKKSAWNENDEMIIKVFNDPFVVTEVSEFMRTLRNLNFDFINSPEDAAEVMHILNKLSLTPRRKFNLVFAYYYGQLIDAPVQNDAQAFLKNFIQNASDAEISDIISKGLEYSTEIRVAFLLRAFRPDRYDDFVLPALYKTGNSNINDRVADDMLHYNEAKYGPVIYKTIRQLEANNLSLDKSFTTIVRLFQKNPSVYKQLMLDACEVYLDNYKNTGYYWEQNAVMVPDSQKEEDMVVYSGFAVYNIWLENKEKGLEWIEKILRARGYINGSSLRLYIKMFGNDAIPLIMRSLHTESPDVPKDYHGAVAAMLKEFELPLFLDQLWETTNHKNKSVRESIGRELCAIDPDVKKKAIALLDNKKAEQRQLGAYLLSYIGAPDTIAALQQAADTETNDDARDIMLQSISPETFQYKSLDDVKRVIDVAAKRGKLKKPSIKWLQTDLPAVYLNDGSAAIQEFVNFLFYRMGRVKEMRSDIEVREALKFIDREKSSAFAKKIINLFFDNKAEAKNKYIIALGALAGDDEVVDKLRISIVNFVEDGRVKMAESAVGALALQGSDKALRWVEFFSRKYRTKKANVGAAAQKALETAAEELGISTHELGDRIVPDFGFDGLFKHFTIEGEEYRAFIDSNFKIAFFNADDKKIKSIPAAAPAELKDEFKAIAKEVRDIVKSQSSRLEYYLIVQRRWTYPQWQKFFLSNPVMFIYATKLLWGVYENGNLKQSFLCNEDTSLIDVNNDEIGVDDSAIIGIVHPTQLSPDELEAWKKQFFNLSIESEFPQLDRRIPDLSDIDMTKAIIAKFQNKLTAQGSIRSTLERYGWAKGPTGDGGYINDFRLLHPEEKLEAILEVEGVGVGYGWGSSEKLQHLYVIDKKRKTPGTWYNSPRNDDEEWIVKFKDLPPIFMNEMLAAIEAIKPAETK